MNDKRHSLYLLELVLDLIIFVTCAAICAGLLVYARALSRDSQMLTDAVFYAQTAAEEWRAGGQPSETLPDGFSVTVTPKAPAEGGESVCITVSHDGKTVYSLEEVARP